MPSDLKEKLAEVSRTLAETRARLQRLEAAAGALRAEVQHLHAEVTAGGADAPHEAASEWEGHIPTRPGVGADESGPETDGGEVDDSMLVADEVSRVP